MARILPVFLFSLLINSASCKNKDAVIEGFTGFIQGSTYSVVYDDNINIEPKELQSKVEKVLHDFDKSLSIYDSSSILSKINRNEEVVTDSFFNEAFRKSVVISRMTKGAFDITVAPLVKAWGFGPDAHKNFSEVKRDSLLKLIGMEKVTLKKGKLIKSDPRVTLDFNAIAQGYSVDVVCGILDKMGIKNYLIEIGGEVRAKGTKNGAKWRIGIDRPFENNNMPGQDLEAIIRISDEALATSGNYRKFYVENGVKYSHTIDPHTGYPAKNNLLSATILASDCATADGIATACMVMGKDSAIKYIGKNPQFMAFLVYSDENGNYRTWMSTALKERISDLEDN